MENDKNSLQRIAEALERIAAAMEEQNGYIDELIGRPNDAPGRLMMGFYNPLEVIDL